MIGKLRVTILGAAVAVSAFGVGGSQCYAKEPPSVGANVDIDVNGIVKSITDAVSSAQNRGGFVKGALETAFNGAKRRHNVMVFNLNGGYDASGLQGVRDFHVYTYSGIPYGVWIFKSGTFVNQGDGGFINWAFEGRFTRTGKDGKTVVFN